MARLVLEEAPYPDPTAQRCSWWRSRKSVIRCEKPVDHHLDDYQGAHYHAGRSRHGQWFFWTEGDKR